MNSVEYITYCRTVVRVEVIFRRLKVNVSRVQKELKYLRKIVKK